MTIAAHNYVFKINRKTIEIETKRNTGKRCEICSKLTIKTAMSFSCLYC